MGKWKSRAKIRLQVAPRHLEGWSEERLLELGQKTLRELFVKEDEVRIEVFIKESHRINMEFRAVSYTESADALAVLKQFELRFFNLDIMRREVSHEEKI
jgi:hypothetical protein